MKNLLHAVINKLFSIHQHLFGQAYSEQGLEKSDSLKNLEYPYILPIYGEAAHKLGYKLPYSAGIGN